MGYRRVGSLETGENHKHSEEGVSYTIICARNGAPIVVAGSKVAWRSVCMSLGADELESQ